MPTMVVPARWHQRTSAPQLGSISSHIAPCFLDTLNAQPLAGGGLVDRLFDNLGCLFSKLLSDPHTKSRLRASSLAAGTRTAGY